MINQSMRLVRGGIALAVLLPIALPAESAAPRPLVSLHDDAVRSGRALLEKELFPKVPGASVAVAANGGIVWTENFGYADLAARRRVTADTRFRIGSISKSLTSVGLARLVERGLLDWDRPIQTYLRDYPATSGTITLRRLGGHLSGIRDYRPAERLSNLAYPDARSRLKLFENDPLETPPGTAFKYSGANWQVIEATMEKASGRDFAEFMEEQVLRPLRLTHTRAEKPGIVDAQRATFYEVDDAGVFVAGPPIDVRHAWANGGYLSSAEDMVRFGSALLGAGFLNEASRQTLFSSQATSDGKPTGYGVGWEVYPQPKVIFHSGWTVGGLAILLLLPDSGTVIAILTNRGALNVPAGHRLHFNVEEIGYNVARLFASPAEPPARSR